MELTEESDLKNFLSVVCSDYRIINYKSRNIVAFSVEKKRYLLSHRNNFIGINSVCF